MNPQIAVGIIADNAENNTAALKNTVQCAQTLTNRIFIEQTVNGAALPFYGNETIPVFPTKSESETDQKNELIEYAETNSTADYLLLLRSGDQFDPKTFEEFRHFIENELERNSLYWLVVRRLHRPDGRRHDLDEEIIKPRILPLNKGLRYPKDTNSPLTEAAKTLMLRINAAPGRIVRFGGEDEKNQRRVHAEKLLQPFQLGYVVEDDLAARADKFFVLGQYNEARQDYLKLIKTASRSDLRLTGYYGVWDSLVKAETVKDFTPEKLTQLLVEALDIFPVDMQLLTWMGIHLQTIGKFDLAVRSYETALRFGKVSLDVWHRLHIREIALTRLALLHRVLGNTYEAMQVMEDGLKEVEDPSDLSRYLMDVYIAEEVETKALNLAATLWGDEELDRMRNVIYGACRATAGSWGEALRYIGKAYQSGERDVLCLRWYALSLLSSRQFPEAVQVLEEWVGVEPSNQEALSFLAAARQPEHFSETLGKIREAQLKALGVPKDKAGKKAPKQAASIERAVKEMILSSGGSGRITSTFGKKAKTP